LRIGRGEGGLDEEKLQSQMVEVASAAQSDFERSVYEDGMAVAANGMHTHRCYTTIESHHAAHHELHVWVLSIWHDIFQR
jgi:hypothetical protein